jgi:hypothetical protein
MEAAVRAAVLSDAALRLPEMARIRHIALRGEPQNSREKAQKAQKITKKDLTQTRKG